MPIDCVRGQITRLAAQVVLADPGLPRELRSVTRRIASLAAALEGELRRFRPLEQRFEQVASQVQDAAGDHRDGELFERLAERFGVLQVRAALQRLHDAHPDAPDNQQR